MEACEGSKKPVVEKEIHKKAEVGDSRLEIRPVSSQYRRLADMERLGTMWQTVEQAGSELEGVEMPTGHNQVVEVARKTEWLALVHQSLERSSIVAENPRRNRERRC